MLNLVLEDESGFSFTWSILTWELNSLRVSFCF